MRECNCQCIGRGHPPQRLARAGVPTSGGRRVGANAPPRTTQWLAPPCLACRARACHSSAACLLASLVTCGAKPRRQRGGQLAMRAVLRAASRKAGLVLPQFQTRQTAPRPLVILCDISGSMEHYSRVMLHFIHGLTQHQPAVHSFLFGIFAC